VGSNPSLTKLNTPVSTKPLGVRAKTGSLGIRTEKQHYENPTSCWCNTNRTSSSHQKVATAGGAMFSMLSSGVVDVDWSPGCGRS
jgi:hypothetical protein